MCISVYATIVSNKTPFQEKKYLVWSVEPVWRKGTDIYGQSLCAKFFVLFSF
jgi:hypothetical protein